jgi:hypothetical protein
MIPKGLTLLHINKATEEIDKSGIRNHRNSYRYKLILNGKQYPPKLVISLAIKYLTNREFPAGRFNAVEAKNYFLHRGFTIVEINDKEERLVNPIAGEDEESSFAEGKAKFKLHRSFERDSAIVKKVKEMRLRIKGELRCDVCDFSFFDKYGKIGVGFIEAHHIVPVSKLGGLKKTSIADLSLVCSNCHRILHRSNPVLTISELRNIL